MPPERDRVLLNHNGQGEKRGSRVVGRGGIRGGHHAPFVEKQKEKKKSGRRRGTEISLGGEEEKGAANYSERVITGRFPGTL